MIDSKYLISQNRTVFEALKQINDLKTGPLVLFVIDDDLRAVGTLTDGDIRRAIVSGTGLSDRVAGIMHRSFKFIYNGDDNLVSELHQMRSIKMKLIPILDEEKHIVELVDLDRNITRLPIDAVLMAGGKGERLRPLTERTPKPLLKVGDKTIIDHNIDRLISYGIRNISVTVNYLKEQIEEHFSDPRNGVFINCVREPQFLGTIGSIKYVENFSNDTILVMNSDVFTNIDFEDFYLHFKKHDAEMSVAALSYSVSVPYGIFDLEGRNIRGLIEKPTYNYYANAGIYLVRRRAIEEIPENTFFHATDLIEKLICEKKKVIRFPLNGTWIDIGNPVDYQRAIEIEKHTSSF